MLEPTAVKLTAPKDAHRLAAEHADCGKRKDVCTSAAGGHGGAADDGDAYLCPQIDSCERLKAHGVSGLLREVAASNAGAYPSQRTLQTERKHQHVSPSPAADLDRLRRLLTSASDNGRLRRMIVVTGRTCQPLIHIGGTRGASRFDGSGEVGHVQARSRLRFRAASCEAEVEGPLPPRGD